MHVFVPRSSFLALLKLAFGVVNAKSPMPALENFLVDACGNRITVTATDMYRSVFGSVDEGVSCPKMGTIALPAKGLLQRIEAMPEGPVEITVDGVAVVVRSAVRKSLAYKMTGLPAEQYPVVAIPKDDMAWTTIPSDATRTLLDKTLFAASDDTTRPSANCVYVVAGAGKITGYSTDGHRVAKVALDVKDIGALSVLIPKTGAEHLRKVVDEALAKKAPVEIGVSGADCFFRVGGLRYAVKLTEAQPFPYDRILPENPTHKAQLPRAALLTSVQAMQVSADDKSNQITFSFKKNELTLSAKDATKGEAIDVLAIDYSGADFSLSFFAPYVVEPLKRLDGDEITIGSDGAPSSMTDARPTTFFPTAPVEGHSFITMIVPMY